MSIFSQASHPLFQPAVKAVLQIAREENFKLYLVGGYLRDQLLARKKKSSQPLDFDFTVLGGTAIELGQKIADKLGGHFVLLDSESDTARVVLQSGDYIDLAACQGGSLEIDLQRRDFTANSLAWDPEEPESLIDLHNCQKDIAERRLRLISEGALLDDPLRLLRGFRLAATLDFELEPESLALIAKHAYHLTEAAPERISYEFLSMLEAASGAQHLVQMGKIGLLEEIFPELTATRQVTNNAYHHLGLFDHSLEVALQSERSIADLPLWAKASLEKPLSAGVSRGAACKLAALLHDIGKPETWAITPEGKHTFIGHDKLGAEMSLPIAKRLRWSKALSQFVEKLIRWHLRPGHLFHQGPPTQKAIYRFYRQIAADTPELVLLALADFRSTCGPGLQEGRQDAEQKLFELLENYSVYIESQQKIPRLLDGSDLMKLLGIAPGPLVGEILEELVEAQSLNEVQDRKQAADFVRKRYYEKTTK
ncbi:MAG: HD domain-containing protein [Candidatus Obscuribacterales bacterium]|nr:HD domain-containing protein [Candidatus Obscuribacterales bacterium]